MSKNVIFLILLTVEFWKPLAAIPEPDDSLAGKANDFYNAPQHAVYHRKARDVDEPLESEEASTSSSSTATPSFFDNSQEGSAYGYTWVKFNGGVKLQCDSLVFVQLLNEHEVDTSRHGFPYLQSKIIPPKVNVGDVLQVWHQGSLRNVSVESYLLIAAKFGDRTVWGAVPAFYFDGNLIPGSPIFRDGKLVSVITKMDGNDKYAVSGISDVSGHFASNRVRVRTMSGAQSVYGGFIGGYADIKTEATREKRGSDGPDNYEIVVGVNTLRLVGWRGDNAETFHTRIGTSHDLTCGEC